MTTTATAIMAIVIAILRRFGLASPPVVTVGCGGSTVGGAVLRLIAASVVCGRMLVSISDGSDAVPSLAVPASRSGGEESLTSAVPSARQNASASSVSTRLHWGQRFIRSQFRVPAGTALSLSSTPRQFACSSKIAHASRTGRLLSSWCRASLAAADHRRTISGVACRLLHAQSSA